MFTIGAILLLVGMVWASERRERQEKAQKASLLFIRQYLRLAVYLLMGIIVMLLTAAGLTHWTAPDPGSWVNKLNVFGFHHEIAWWIISRPSPSMNSTSPSTGPE